MNLMCSGYLQINNMYYYNPTMIQWPWSLDTLLSQPLLWAHVSLSGRKINWCKHLYHLALLHYWLPPFFTAVEKRRGCCYEDGLPCHWHWLPFIQLHWVELNAIKAINLTQGVHTHVALISLGFQTGVYASPTLKYIEKHSQLLISLKHQ